jgi:hypothetical protein
MRRGPGRNHRGQRRGLLLRRALRIQRPDNSRGNREANRGTSKLRLHAARGRTLIQRMQTARWEIQIAPARAWIGELMTVQV